MRALVLTRAVVAGLVAATVVYGSAIADDARPRGGFGPMMMQQWGGGMMFGRNADDMRAYMAEYMVDRIDGRLAFMKTELKITDAQEAAWQRFANTVRETTQSHNEQMREMMSRYFGEDADEVSLPDSLDYQEAHLAQRLEEIRNLREAVEALYAVLGEEQKKAASEVVIPLMGGMGGMGGMGMMGYGRGMMGGWR
ncbi:MAG: Spy/CpxP family protein refolding chaperone [Flavobacteriaceae bacterium]